MMKLFSPFIKDTTRGDVKRLQPIINQINSYEPEIQAYTDKELKEQFSYLREEIQREYQSIRLIEDVEEKKKKTQILLDKFLPRVFAFTREASLRTLGMRHYDEQLIGGIILHQGKIAEMKTGEGKTLVATLPLVLNALIGEGAHLVTVNDYLARRDAGWNGPLFSLLGLKVASIGHELSQVFDSDFVAEGETDAVE